MNAAQLIGLASARGIDLKHIAGVASETGGIARQRARTAVEKKFGVDVPETASGRETRGYRPPAWGVGELGMAAQGLGAIPWAAALYSFAGDRNGYWLLWHALANEAHRLGRREYWPPRGLHADGERRFYRELLAELVLVADSNRHLFVAAPQLYAIAMGVSVETWDEHLRGPFRSLQGSYDRWLALARGAIGRWIRGED